MCDKLENINNIILDINYLCNYISNDCSCNYCLKTSKLFRSINIVLDFLQNLVKKRHQHIFHVSRYYNNNSSEINNRELGKRILFNLINNNKILD